MRPTTPLLCGLLTFLASCGGDPSASLTEGYNSLNSGKYQDALGSFDAALGGLEATDAKHLDARLGRCQALAHTDPEAAVREFTALAQGQKLEVGAYTGLVAQFRTARDYQDAAKVMGAAVAAHPESDRLKAELQALGDEASKAGDADAVSALKGLGYAGND